MPRENDSLRVSSDDVGRDETVEVELDDLIQHLYREYRSRYYRINPRRHSKVLVSRKRSISRIGTSC
jgi:hypothetical protein